MSIVVFIIIVVVMIPFIIYASNEPNRQAAKQAAEAEADEKEAALEKLESGRAALFEKVSSNWEFSALALVDGQTGIVSMDASGLVLNLSVYSPEGGEFKITSNELISIRAVRAISIDQPVKRRTVTHIDKTPVAVQKKKSTMGRAIVGGVVAGPVGAVVGGISSLSGGSNVEYHKTNRTETVYSKGVAKLVVSLDDLKRPTRVVEFDDHIITNEWSSRIWTAMQRVR